MTLRMPGWIISRFLCMRILFTLVASFLLSKSFLFRLLLRWWCFLLPISSPLDLSLVYFCLVGWLDGSVLLFHFLGQVSPHKGKIPRSGFMSSRGCHKSFAKFLSFSIYFPFFPNIFSFPIKESYMEQMNGKLCSFRLQLCEQNFYK